MIIRTTLFAAAAAVALTGGPVMAATYGAYNFVHADKDKKTHSVKFKKRKGVSTNRLRGAKGKGKKKFSFENGSGDSMGQFESSGDTGTLTGTIRNAAGQKFKVVMNFKMTKDPRSDKEKAAASSNDWSYYRMTSGTLTSMTDDLASFDLRHKGKVGKGKKRRSIAAQFGNGANLRNVDMIGLFAKFKAKEQNCRGSGKKCQKFNGNLVLKLDELGGAGGSLDDGGFAVVPLPASALLLPVALGGLGVAGAIGRRRRKS